jgi:hypothetical protein
MEDTNTYGSQLDAEKLITFLEYAFHRNDELSLSGKKGTPICIWGTHGLGKTHIVTEIAKEKGWHLSYCAPAQFEEMGDLHGLPEIDDPDPDVHGDERTVYRPPDWVPKVEGPGILLLDDLNRADDRILRGLMQLLQNFELFSWHLPKRWMIVATANPEGGEYSVTPMDDAMLTRLLHVTLKFDPKAWAKWALSTGVDPRGVNFILTYPETVSGKRTTPRTLSQFFDQIQGIEDWKNNTDLIEIFANSSLDPETTTSFLSYLQDDMHKLISPEEILDGDPDEVINKIQDAAGSKENRRTDRLTAIFNRLLIYLTDKSFQAKPHHKDQIRNLFKIGEIPADIKMGFYSELQKKAREQVREVFRDKEIAQMILNKFL